ncbi:MAG TPA: DivIVA domain-containing protein [Mycobacterium sp.]|jgi:DivIVA domain-containing protein|nr:DivIVA domain-containing protein [Mycobacterium sp.]
MSDAGLTAEDVRSATFNKPPWGERGYDEASVDNFLQLVARRLDGQGQPSADDVREVRLSNPPIGKCDRRFPRQGRRDDRTAR